MVAPSESVGEVRRSAAGRNKPCATEAFKSQRSGQAAVSYDCSHLLKSALPAAVSSAFSLQQGSPGSRVKSPSDGSLLCYPLLFPRLILLNMEVAPVFLFFIISYLLQHVELNAGNLLCRQCCTLKSHMSHLTKHQICDMQERSLIIMTGF